MLMVEPENRREFLSNILVVGGNTLFENFTSRLQTELCGKDFWGLQNKIKVKQ